MVGIGVGSGEWQELDSSHERDEPNLVILLRAPVIFHPAPFMLASRTNKNDREQLNSGYISELKMKLLPESCSCKCVDNLVVKKWERESFLAIKLELKSNGNPSKNVWEGVRVKRVSMRAQHPSLGLYLKENERRHKKRSRPRRLGDRWSKWGAHNGWSDPGFRTKNSNPFIVVIVPGSVAITYRTHFRQ
jgi:hypothetical protein